MDMVGETGERSTRRGGAGEVPLPFPWLVRPAWTEEAP